MDRISGVYQVCTGGNMFTYLISYCLVGPVITHTGLSDLLLFLVFAITIFTICICQGIKIMYECMAWRKGGGSRLFMAAQFHPQLQCKVVDLYLIHAKNIMFKVDHLDGKIRNR